MAFFIFTWLWKNYVINSAALRTRHFAEAVPFLFLVDPPLNAHLVHPLGGATALAGLNP
jgi:hypothetical protein